MDFGSLQDEAYRARSGSNLSGQFRFQMRLELTCCGFLKISHFLDRILIEHKDMKNRSDSKLQIYSIFPIIIRSRNGDIVEKLLQHVSNPYVRHFPKLARKTQIYSKSLTQLDLLTMLKNLTCLSVCNHFSRTAPSELNLTQLRIIYRVQFFVIPPNIENSSIQ